MLRLISLFVLLSYVAARHEFYDGYSLYEIKVKHVDETKFINNLQHEWGVDVWSHAVPGRPGLVMVSKEKKESFQNILNSEGIEFKIQSDNVKELLDLEDGLLEDASRKSFNASKMNGLPFDRIYTYHQVDTYLQMLAEAYPRTVTLVNAGTSFEGRDIRYLKISTTNFQDTSKPIVFLESLLHAREWVTLPASLYAIHKLVIDVTEGDLLEDIDWIILPIANPDGYVHSHLENRFWRKNRANGYMVGDICVGVDLNRNFDVDWSTASSNTVCMETFHGSGPFSEPETAIIRDIFSQYSDRMELFVDIHSFGSMILYGYGNGVLPANGLFLHMVGVQMAQAIDAVKTSWNSDYIVGNVALVLYDASGSASDYSKFAGVPFSYTFELPGYRLGIGALGFLVDPRFIEQAGFETWEGIKVGARYVRNNFRAKHKV